MNFDDKVLSPGAVCMLLRLLCTTNKQLDLEAPIFCILMHVDKVRSQSKFHQTSLTFIFKVNDSNHLIGGLHEISLR